MKYVIISIMASPPRSKSMHVKGNMYTHKIPHNEALAALSHVLHTKRNHLGLNMCTWIHIFPFSICHKRNKLLLIHFFGVSILSHTNTHTHKRTLLPACLHWTLSASGVFIVISNCVFCTCFFHLNITFLLFAHAYSNKSWPNKYTRYISIFVLTRQEVKGESEERQFPHARIANDVTFFTF